MSDRPSDKAADELRNIVGAKRFNRDDFANDTEFADWAQSRARHCLSAIDAAATAQAGEWVLPHGWRIERVDARTLAVCGRGIRTHVEFGDSFYPFFLALSAVPPAPQPPPAEPAEPSAEHWRRACNELVHLLSTGATVESRLPFNDYGEWAFNRSIELAREGGK